ncbi:hypothetical protein VTN02DRAFT_1931 [Thermoascus thermophilus]
MRHGISLPGGVDLFVDLFSGWDGMGWPFGTNARRSSLLPASWQRWARCRPVRRGRERDDHRSVPPEASSNPGRSATDAHTAPATGRPVVNLTQLLRQLSQNLGARSFGDVRARGPDPDGADSPSPRYLCGRGPLGDMSRSAGRCDPAAAFSEAKNPERASSERG